MSNKPHRNGPCPCGSGKKYKKCCMEKDLDAKRGVGQGVAQPLKNSFRDTIKDVPEAE